MGRKTASEHLHNAIFVGEDGLRAGWALALFLLLFLPAATAMLQLIRRFGPLAPAAASAIHSRHEETVALALLQSAPMLVVLLGCTALMARVEHRRFGVYGLGGTHRLRHLFAGAATGLIAIAMLVVMLVLTHHLVIDSVLPSGSAVVRSGLLWLVAFALVAGWEEFLLRGFLQFTLARGLGGVCRAARLRRARSLGFALAALVLSLLFGAGHRTNPGESPLGLATAALFGLVSCLALFRSGSLWWAIGFHALWDWGQSFLFGVADSGVVSVGRLLRTRVLGASLLSGGTTGPEGSLFVLPVLLLAGVAVWLTLPQGPQPPVEPNGGHGV